MADRFYDLIIVGYGPVGSVAANLAGYYGLDTAVIEETASVYHLPRAAHFDNEIMRLFRRLGLADEIAPAVRPATGIDFVNAAGRRLFRFFERAGLDLRKRARGFWFYQPDLERFLRAGVQRFPHVDVHLATRVETISQSDERAETTARDLSTDRVSAFRGRYLIACDGAHSLTRDSIGATLEDYAFDQFWLVVDIFLKHTVKLPEITQQICDPSRPAIYVRSAGQHRRWEFMLMPGETAKEMERPQRVWELLSPWITPEDAEVVRAVVYSFHSLAARRWRDRRIFIAGDAAHQMPPFLGQGMCSGIRDVANLAWKLQLVVKGLARDSILDTYQTERRPHVLKVTEKSIELGRIIQTVDPEIARRRDEAYLGPPGAAGRQRPPDFSMPPLGEGLAFAPLAEDARRIVGNLLPQALVRVPGGGTVLLNELLADGFTIIARSGVRSALGQNAGAFWQKLGVRWLILEPSGTRPKAQADVIVAEDVEDLLASWLTPNRAIAIRPDEYVFGAADGPEEFALMTDALKCFVA
jgi:3-(3-hydroxy-phenyl)propionate hydroxylase